jgi:bifunctional non-homologous end joining protein LigD
MIWDHGTYEPEDGADPVRAIRSGRMRFTLRGTKLKGSWALARMRGKQWLLMKMRDRQASTADITLTKPRSVVSRRLLAGIAREAGGNVEKAATGDPARPAKGTTSRPKP